MQTSIEVDTEPLLEPRPDPMPSVPVTTTPIMTQQISNQDLAQLVAGLAQNQNSLQVSLQTLVDNLTSSKKAGKPHKYDGTRGEDAHHFMAALELYFNNHAHLSTANVNDRIIATILFLTGEAAIWATPISEKINAGTGHGYADWDAFKAAFKKHFETASAQEDAR